MVMMIEVERPVPLHSEAWSRWAELGPLEQTVSVPQNLYPLASVSSCYNYLYPWGGRSQNALEQKANLGQPPDRGAPYKHPAYSYALSSSFCLPTGRMPHVS